MRHAREIYQANIDGMSRALLTGDIDLMLRHVAVPGVMITRDAEVVLRTVADWQDTMRRFADHMAGIGAETCHRTCVRAKYLGGRGDTSVGLHRTHFQRGTEDWADPFLNQMMLIPIDGQWKSVRLETSRPVADYPIIDVAQAEIQRREFDDLARAVRRA